MGKRRCRLDKGRCRLGKGVNRLEKRRCRLGKGVNRDLSMVEGGDRITTSEAGLWCSSGVACGSAGQCSQERGIHERTACALRSGAVG